MLPGTCHGVRWYCKREQGWHGPIPNNQHWSSKFWHICFDIKSKKRDKKNKYEKYDPRQENKKLLWLNKSGPLKDGKSKVSIKFASARAIVGGVFGRGGGVGELKTTTPQRVRHRRIAFVISILWFLKIINDSMNVDQIKPSTIQDRKHCSSGETLTSFSKTGEKTGNARKIEGNDRLLDDFNHFCIEFVFNNYYWMLMLKEKFFNWNFKQGDIRFWHGLSKRVSFSFFYSSDFFFWWFKIFCIRFS